MLKRGLYEQVINGALKEEIVHLEDCMVHKAGIDDQEASKILSQYVSKVIEQSLNEVKDRNGDIGAQIEVVNAMIKTLIDQTGEKTFDKLRVDKDAEQLLALLDCKNNIHSVNKKLEIIRPETSIAQSSLFTGAIHEPQMFSELKKEIISCERIDLLVSFIKWSGLRLIIEELEQFTNRGGKLRVITTSYMGATDIKAIEALSTLSNTEIKVSYDTKRTRLHAKTYVFYRETGFTTAYVGSSNLSNAAISSGLEWNVKIAQNDLPETIKKIAATFESYWYSSEFEVYGKEDRKRLLDALQYEQRGQKIEEGIETYAFEIRPYPYQQEILDQLEAERKVRGHYRNLVVAATGTGKTVISAFDYKRCCQIAGKKLRLLFVAHREEILKQSLACFRGILRDANFGDLFVGNYRPEQLDHLFVSIQTINAKDFIEKTTPDFYDFIVVDEFHHVAAPTYQKMLNYYKPKVLLGLTATPERMDGKDILGYFENRIAAQIRLPEAIDRKLLCPFQYFGVTDDVDLSKLKWKRGGYDQHELEEIYVLETQVAIKRAKLIIASLGKYTTDINDIKGLGFCVSVKHAQFMSEQFNQNGIASIYLTGKSKDEERDTAKARLVNGEIKMIFVVDLYNEGVDIPEVNTILFLRPTESLTVFLQQLGRGLRLAENKECLTVLDFIGQAHKKYSFEGKFAALLTDTNRGLSKEIKNHFVSVPKGCYIQLERQAREYILSSITKALDRKSGIIARIASFEEDTGIGLSLNHFLNYYHITPETLYNKGSFARLCVLSGKKQDFNEALENVMTKAFARICAINSKRWLDFLVQIFEGIELLEVECLTKEEKQMLHMFEFTVWQKSVTEVGFESLKEALVAIKKNTCMYDELLELLHYNLEHIDFVDERVDLGFACPLDLHCTYTRDQILVALDFMKPQTVREGTKYLPDKKVDVFFVTLNKSDKDYSPTTMYDDYSINEWLFHWQSQSTTSETSPTGKRYINHKDQGSKVLLFVREYKRNSLGASPYTYLGLVDYVTHTGSRPMSITWRLEKSIPAKFLKKTNKLIVG